MSVNQRNLALIREAYLRRETHGEFLPAVYVIELTNICNLNCIICPRVGIPTSDRGDLSIASAKHIAEAIAPYAELVMLYFMGEPLLHPKFCEIVLLFRQYIRGAIAVSTNATRMTDEAANVLIECVDLPICCVDRHSPEEYESIRRGAVYSDVTANVKRLIALGRQRSKSVIVKGLDFGMSPEEQKAFRAYWEGEGAIVNVSWVNTWAGTLPHLRERARIPMPYINEPRQPCADLWFKMVINHQAKAVQCCLDWNYSTANMVLGAGIDLSTLWHSPTMQRMRKLHSQEKFTDASPICGRCKEWAGLEDLSAYTTRDAAKLSLVF